MSDKQVKRPAHEVILGKLEGAIRVKLDMRWLVLGTGISLLLSILCEMVIPEKHLQDVISRLRSIAERANGAGHTDVYTDVMAVVDEISK